MSARTRLVDALAAGLGDTPERRYRVIGAPDVPAAIAPKTFELRVWQTEVTPGPALGSLLLPLTLWVCTGATRPGDADDALDGALDEVLSVLHPLEWVRWTRAERGVFDNDNGTAWHGWRFDLTAGGRIETTED